MKLLILTPVYAPYKGGTATVAEQNAQMARKAGHTVHVITPYYRLVQQGKQEEREGISITRISPLFSFGNSACIGIPFSFLKQADCIHVHYPFISGSEFQLLIAKIFFKKKIIVTYHMDLVAQGTVRKLLFFLYSTFIFPILFFIADTLIVTSLDYAKNCRITSLLKIFSKKIVELPNSISQKITQPDSSSLPIFERYGIKTQEKILLFVGSLDRAHYFKGIPVLLQSVKELLVGYKEPVVLVIVGEGDLKHAYQARAHALGISQRVVFTGSAPQEDLDVLYARAVCVVLPSITASEAFGVVLVEGMAHGTPGIASNLPGVRSVIQDGVNGLLVQPNNPKDLTEKINVLLNDDVRAKEMGQRGKELVEEKYSYDVIKKKYLKIIDF